MSCQLPAMRQLRTTIGFLIIMGCAGPPPAERIMLFRSGCFGPCPRYELTIDSSGLVTFEGRPWGYPLPSTIDTRDSTRIEGAKFEAIAIAFERAWSRARVRRITWGLESCPNPVTDGSTVMVVRDLLEQSDTLELYYGCRGAPQQIGRLGDFIDTAVDVSRWIGKRPE